MMNTLYLITLPRKTSLASVVIKAIDKKAKGQVSSLFGEGDDLYGAPAPVQAPAPRIRTYGGQVKRVVEPVESVGLGGLFDETLHPRAAEGQTQMNPETGRVIHGGQFAPGNRIGIKTNGKHREILGESSEDESPETLSESEAKRRTRKKGKRNGSLLPGSGSLFDENGDESARSAADSGANLPDDSRRGTGHTGDQSEQHVEPIVAEEILPETVLSEVRSGSHTVTPSWVKSGHDFIITDDTHGHGGVVEKYERNVEAITLLRQLEAEGRLATPSEQAVLAGYTGWGWAQEIFAADGAYSPYPQHRERYKELKELLGNEFYDVQRSVLNAHYTSPQVIRGMWEALRGMGFTGGRILEPAAGIGNFIGAMPTDMAANSRWTAVEMEPISAEICKQLYQSADVQHSRTQDAQLANDFFDLAISNVPFGSYGVSDQEFRRSNRGYLSAKIHNYFFAKALDKVRPGGLIAFVTSTGTMDAPTSDNVREYLSGRADLLGAVRLPNDTFSKNAGTQVTTDIIFLRKRMEGETPNGESWRESVPSEYEHNGIRLQNNEYYSRHQRNILGTPIYNDMYGKPDLQRVADVVGGMAVAPDGSDASLTERIAAAGAEMGKVYKAQNETPGTDDAVARTAAYKEGVKPGAFFVGEDGSLYTNEETGPALYAKQKGLVADRIRGMIGLRERLFGLYRTMMSENATDEQVATEQFEMGLAYDAFKNKFGLINDTANSRAFAADPDYFRICALEKEDRKADSPTFGQKIKGDIFTKRVISPYKPKRTADNAKDAMAISLNDYGRIDLDHMSSVTGIHPAQLENDLISQGLAFHNPVGGLEEHSAYLSGDVRQKLKQAEAAARTDSKYQGNVTALTSVIPPDLSPVDIDVRLGAPYVAPAYVEQFIREHLQMSNYASLFVSYNAGQGKWTVKKPDNVYHKSARATSLYGTEDYPFVDLVTDALNHKSPVVRRSEPDGMGGRRTWVDADATEAAKAKQREIKEKFKEWIWKDEARRDDVARTYNDTYNCYVHREYTGQHLDLPGISDEAKERLNPHVKDAIFRQVQSPSTLLAHATGAGKTWEVAGAVMEKRRLGLAKKPMIVVPNHLTEQWAKEFADMYPGANVLIVKKSDLEKQNRRKFLARVQFGDWDAVVIAQSSFGKVPVTAAEFKAHYESEIDKLREYLVQARSEAREAGEREGRGLSVKNIQNKLESLQKKMEDRLGKMADTQDSTINWHDLGVDDITVDEAHDYKNLGFASKMGQLKGLPQGAGSDRALDLYLKVRAIQKKNGGRGVTFATATPISNSIAEVYTMMRYLAPTMMGEKDCEHFDSWAHLFTDTDEDLEATPAGKLKLTQRLTNFSNLPELAGMFRTFSDVLLDDDLKVPRPEAEYVAVTSPMSPEQLGHVRVLAARAERLTQTRVDPREDNMLKITSEGRKNSLDHRLLNSGAKDWQYGKVNMAVDKLYSEWERSHDIRGTQAVFMDMGVPNRDKQAKADTDTAPAKIDEEESLRRCNNQMEGHKAATAQGYENGARETDVFGSQYIAWLRGDRTEDPPVPYNEHLKLLALRLDAAWDGDDVEGAVMQDALYGDMKRKLIAKGVPESQIAFIHDAKSDRQKFQLFQDVNRGTVRFLLGSTQKMGTGMNAQERMVALHHMDCPWRPADLKQREGRIIRKGNINKSVRIYNYIGEGKDDVAGFDAFLWQLIRSKAKMIDAIMKGDVGVRRADDIGDMVFQAGHFINTAMGNPLLQERYETDTKINRLMRLEREHNRGVFTAQDRLKSLPGEIAGLEKVIAGAKAAQVHRDAHTPDLSKPMKVNVGGQEFDKGSEGVAAILERIKTRNYRPGDALGTIGGFEITAEPNPHGGEYSHDIYVSPSSQEHNDYMNWKTKEQKSFKDVYPGKHIPYRSGIGVDWKKLPRDEKYVPLPGEEEVFGHAPDPVGVYSALRRLVTQNLDGAVKGHEATLESAQKDLASFKESVRPFRQQEELDALRKRLSEIDTTLKKDEKRVKMGGVEDIEVGKGEDLEKSLKTSTLGMRFFAHKNEIKYHGRETLPAAGGNVTHHYISYSNTPQRDKNMERRGVGALRRHLRMSGMRIGATTEAENGTHHTEARDARGAAHHFHFYYDAPAAPKGGSAKESPEPAPKKTLGDAPKSTVFSRFRDKFRTDRPKARVAESPAPQTPAASPGRFNPPAVAPAPAERKEEGYKIPNRAVFAASENRAAAGDVADNLTPEESHHYFAYGHRVVSGGTPLSPSEEKHFRTLHAKRLGASGPEATYPAGHEPTAELPGTHPGNHPAQDIDLWHHLDEIRGATYHESKQDDRGSYKENAHLITHNQPQVATEKLYKRFHAAGMQLSPVTYGRKNINGKTKHVYRFSVRDRRGNMHTIHILRPHKEGGVPMTYEGKKRL